MGQRQQGAARFRLDLSAIRANDGPGPGTYRVDTGRSPGRQAPGPYCPSSTFGSPRKTPRALAAAAALAQQYNTPRLLTAMARTVPCDGPTTAISIGYNSSRGEKMQYPWRSVKGSSGGHQSASSSIAGGNAAAAVQQTGNTPLNDASHKQSAAAALPATARADREKDNDGPNSSTLGGLAFSFGPPGGVAAGKQRRRSKEGNVYISAQHTAKDPSTVMTSQIPAANAYSTDGKLDLLSTHQGSGTPRFGAGTRRAGAKMYLSSEHAKADSSLVCSPGPGTATLDLMGSISATASGHIPYASPRFGPAPSPRAKLPYISKEHEVTRFGQDSPGPAAYDATSAARAVLDDRRTAHFGTSRRDMDTTKPTDIPGPGAYLPDEAKSSVFASGPSFSMGATGHGKPPGSATTATPGAGTYDIGLADNQRFKNPGVATVAGRLKHGGIEVDTCSPGPAAYIPLGPVEGMGFAAELEWERRKIEAFIRHQQRHMDIEAVKQSVGSNGHQCRAIDLVLRHHILAPSLHTESREHGTTQDFAAKSHSSRSRRRSTADSRLLTATRWGKGVNNPSEVCLSRAGSSTSRASESALKVVEETVLKKPISHSSSAYNSIAGKM